jgi:hypothetical protein
MLECQCVATFEEPVKKLDTKHGFIDLFWKGVLLVEQKSAGRANTALFRVACLSAGKLALGLPLVYSR